MEIGFATALLVFGALLWLVALLAGVMRGTVLSISVFAVACGAALAEAGVVHADPSSSQLRHLAQLTLVVTLFADGLLVERELLRRHWDSPARALIVAMPLTIVMLAGVAKLLFDSLSWAEAFLLAAVLAPTDPVVSSVVVTARNVPPRIRHALNLESGLNDGLALPFVLFFLVLASPGGEPGGEGLRLLGEAVAGAAIGGALGYLGGKLRPRVPLGGLMEQDMGFFALGVAFVSYGVAELTVGNGLVCAFAAGLTIGVIEAELPVAFSHLSEFVSSLAQLIAFFAFGALIVATGFDVSVLALAAMAAFAFLVARPLSVLVASAGSGLSPRQRVFVAWFGPKGVASMLYALFVLNSDVPQGSLLFDVAAFVILASIVAHGLTDTVAARWIGNAADRESQAASDRERAPAEEGEEALGR